jgi:signal transduction histidine kinase
VQTNTALTLAISDDGAGLGRNRPDSRSGLGLGVMQHRARAIGAELTITSQKNEGVTIRCVLPRAK